MHFMQIGSVLQTENRSELAKNWFSVALGLAHRADPDQTTFSAPEGAV